MSGPSINSNKRPSTSMSGPEQQRPSPAGRRKRDGDSYSPSPSTESGRRVVAARRAQYTGHLDIPRASSSSSSAMAVDGADESVDATARQDSNSVNRRRDSESVAMRQQPQQQHARAEGKKPVRAMTSINSQHNARLDETRAKARAIADPSSAWPVGAIAPRPHPGYTFKEAEYDQEISLYMVDMDNEVLPNPESMDSQPEVQWYMRPYLVDFLIEVHAQFRLRPEVLYLAMNIVDRYVSKRVVYKKHYQLVGCASLWIAAKFEDAKDKVPLTKELSDMCCKAYDEAAFIQMEGHVLGTIGWTLGGPTSEAWLRMYCMDDLEDQRTANVARFIMEVSLFIRECVGIPSYDLAAGALMLARFICGRPKRRDLSTTRSPIFGPESAERAVRVAYQIDARFAHDSMPVSDVLRRKYTPSYYHSAAPFVIEWYSKQGNRFVNHMEPTIPARLVGFPPISPSIPSGINWHRGSWASSSPSASSSENGDEGPLTPVTPIHTTQGNVDPFSQHAKENLAPTPTRVKPGPIPSSIRPISTTQPPSASSVDGKLGIPNANMLYPQRQALHALPTAGDLAMEHRAQSQLGRRLSN